MASREILGVGASRGTRTVLIWRFTNRAAKTRIISQPNFGFDSFLIRPRLLAGLPPLYIWIPSRELDRRRLVARRGHVPLSYGPTIIPGPTMKTRKRRRSQQRITEIVPRPRRRNIMLLGRDRIHSLAKSTRQPTWCLRTVLLSRILHAPVRLQ
jgi:hypothetical protein